MKRRTLTASVALLILLALSSCSLFGGMSMASLPDEAQEFVRLMNQHRQNQGLTPLMWDNGLGQVAQAHSEDMLARDYFSHENSDGESPFDRMTAAGISYTAAAENIAMGYSTGQAVLDGWLNSAGHKENIESAAFTHHGLGYLADGHYWTHVFAAGPEF